MPRKFKSDAENSIEDQNTCGLAVGVHKKIYKTRVRKNTEFLDIDFKTENLHKFTSTLKLQKYQFYVYMLWCSSCNFGLKVFTTSLINHYFFLSNNEINFVLHVKINFVEISENGHIAQKRVVAQISHGVLQTTPIYCNIICQTCTEVTMYL